MVYLKVIEQKIYCQYFKSEGLFVTKYPSSPHTCIRLKLSLKCETLQHLFIFKLPQLRDAVDANAEGQNNSMRLIIKFQVDYFTWFMVNCLIGRLKIYTHMLVCVCRVMKHLRAFYGENSIIVDAM